MGHVHAKLMAMYAVDAAKYDEPWLHWENRGTGGHWRTLHANPGWVAETEYRRKPCTINGFVVPAPSANANNGEWCYMPSVAEDDLCVRVPITPTRIARGMCYRTPAAAVAVAKAMLGIDPKWGES